MAHESNGKDAFLFAINERNYDPHDALRFSLNQIARGQKIPDWRIREMATEFKGVLDEFRLIQETKTK